VPNHWIRIELSKARDKRDKVKEKCPPDFQLRENQLYSELDGKHGRVMVKGPDGQPLQNFLGRLKDAGINVVEHQTYLDAGEAQ
jgi:hypothetical protein